MLALILTALLATAAQDKPRIEEGKVKELQKERIATLKEAAEVSFKLTRANRQEIRESLEDRMALLRVELEVSEKASERLALYKQALDDLKAHEELAKARFANRQGSELPLHLTKAKRLEVEIALERAKIEVAKEKK